MTTSSLAANAALCLALVCSGLSLAACESSGNAGPEDSGGTGSDSGGPDATTPDATTSDGSAAESGSEGSAPPSDAGDGGTVLRCDDSMKTAFKPDTKTTVLLVKAFKQGDPLTLSADGGVDGGPTVGADMCLVKLLIGPGFQDTSPTAPSTSPGSASRSGFRPPARGTTASRT
jgi:hypothetical protein